MIVLIILLFGRVSWRTRSNSGLLGLFSTPSVFSFLRALSVQHILAALIVTTADQFADMIRVSLYASPGRSCVCNTMAITCAIVVTGLRTSINERVYVSFASFRLPYPASMFSIIQSDELIEGRPDCNQHRTNVVAECIRKS